MQQHIHAYYSGQVQGIGFRFTVRGIAQELRVGGWVRNMPDGRVEVVAQTDARTLKDFLDKIYACFSRHIQEVDVQQLAAEGSYQDFEIRF